MNSVPEKTATSCVIMAVYDGDRPTFLQESISSLFGARGIDRILIGVDGPISLAAADVLMSIRTSKKVEVVRFEVNRGLAHILNDLIDIALMDETCSVVYRMDADDASCPDRFVRQKQFLDANPDIGVVGAAAWLIDDSGGIQGEIQKPIEHAQLIRRLPFDSPFVHPTVAIKANVLRAGHRYPTTTIRFEDVALWANLARAGIRFGNVTEKLLHYRIGPCTIRRRSGIRKAASETRVRLGYIAKMMPHRIDLIFLVLGIAISKMLLPTALLRFLYDLRSFRLKDH